MAPRKSNVSTVSNGADEAAESPAPKPVKDGMSVEELTLPKSMVARLAKGVLPPNTQIQKDALLALHKSATVFVSYIASNSNENARTNNKKTIAPTDVFAALKDAELENFLPRLEAELQKYNDIQCEKRNTYRRKVKEEKASTTAVTVEIPVSTDKKPTASVQGAGSLANGHVDDGPRPAKKLRTESGQAIVPDGEGEGGNVDLEEGGATGSEADVVEHFGARSEA
nr:dna polymerase epsilon subunit d [Quercus suber]